MQRPMPVQRVATMLRPRSAILVRHTDTDAAGEPVVIAEAAGDPNLTLVRVVRISDTTATIRRHIWEANPHCVECHRRTESPELAAYVVVEDDVRVACPGAHYRAAVLRLNAVFANWTEAAAGKGAPVEIVRDLRLVVDDERADA